MVHLQSWRKHSSRYPALGVVAMAAALACGGALAQIRTDGTVGAAQTLQGPGYVIPQTLGRLSGANLFHSFQTFNIGSNESATFTTSTSGIANVISRVTGGDGSQINGTLRLSAIDGAPAFFFINPAGLTFGKGATIDVPGAFHAGTADYLRFADGRLYADPAKGSSFSSAPPEAFGFLGGSRATVNLQDGAVLVTRRTHGLTLAGGDITIDNATIATGAADIRLAAVGRDVVEVSVAGALPAASGRLDMRNGASVTSYALDGLAGGRVAISAGDVAIDGGAYLYSTHDSGSSSAGAGGDISVVARNTLSLSNGASISTDASGSGAAGAISIQAGQLQLQSGGYLYSATNQGSSANAGAIDVATQGALSIASGASISTALLGSGRANPIRLNAGSLSIDNGYVRSDGPGGASPITLTVAGTLALANGGTVSSNTTGAADAGAVSVRAHDISLSDKSNISSVATQGAGKAGAIDVLAVGDVALSSGSNIYSRTLSAGNAASVNITAANLVLDNAEIASNPLGSGNAASGNVGIALTGDLTLRNGSAIDTSTLSSGSAGAVQVQARDITVQGSSRINSNALAGSGAAGSIDLVASRSLVLHDDASVSTGSSTAGDGGPIRISAGSVLLDGGSSINSTSGLSQTDGGPPGSGRGGNITVTTPGSLVLREASSIGAITGGAGAAGAVQIQAGSITLETAADISTSSLVGSHGDAGTVRIVTPGDLLVRNGAFINSDSAGAGNAGAISVQARNITLDDAGRIASVTFTGSGGQGGSVDLQASGDVLLTNSSGLQDRGGSISTSTFSSGNGGAINVRGANVRLDGPFTLIASLAQTQSSGNAGSISVQAAGDLVVRQGGITTSTGGSGAAGAVQLQAARVLLDGASANVSAAAGASSGGQTGSVQVQGSESITLGHGAFVSISNAATVPNPATRQPTTLSVAAPDIRLQQGLITAASSGNVAASDIAVDFGRSLTLAQSGITTTANTGNGGAIRIHGGSVLSLSQSLVTTSVLGTAGNGGDIEITTAALALDRGFIQANTAARDASGGLVRIRVDTLVASGNTLLLGGNTVYTFRPDIAGFNVIQAAAPTGISGVVDVTSPVLDVTGSLRVLRGDVIDAGGLGRSLCQASGGSTLAQAGRGGMVASASELLRAEREGGAPVAAVLPDVAPGQGLLARSAAPVFMASRARGCL